MFIARAKSWNQFKCSSTDQWIQMWYIHRMEYYSAIKKNKITKFAATWMQPEMIEVIQKKRDKHHMITFICAI